MLVLSLFPGIDLLGKAFEEHGFCVVRGPEKFLGQDIREFKPVPDKFGGIIAGAPCQDFSLLRRAPPTGYGLEMLQEFKRCVMEARPQWWLLENVATVPDVKIEGYHWQRFDLNQGWVDDYSRLRHFQFGAIVKSDLLNVTRGKMRDVKGGAALATDSRSVTELLQIQGLTNDFAEKLDAFTVAGKKRVIGNAVPLSMGNVLAELIAKKFLSVTNQVPEQNLNRDDIGGPINKNVTAEANKIISWLDRCACQCGRVVTGRRKYFDSTCRKRAQRRRDSAATKKGD